MRIEELFNNGWRFAKFASSDPGYISEKGEAFEPFSVETGREDKSPPAFAEASFDDAKWRLLDLPHDWGVEGAFRQELSGNTGKLPWAGIGWYRKRFTLPADAAKRHIWIEFDGAMANAAVWLNGNFLGRRPYGYSSFGFDLDRFLHPGADNILALRLDNPPESSRWYPGGGIYRNVRLVSSSKVFIPKWGMCITTPELSEERASVSLRVEAENRFEPRSVSGEEYLLVARILELASEEGLSGREIAHSSMTIKIPHGGKTKVDLSLIVPDPKLWETDSPALYYVKASILHNGEILDSAEERFGIRTAIFDPEKGFLLNGRRVEMRGVCEHHDSGPLGAAVNPWAIERKLGILKEMGCNAIRTSHNPPAPELLNLCDRMGFLVMDEAFDCWKDAKTRNDYHLHFAEWHEADVRDLVRRDKNHPSVVIWSAGNEILDLARGGDSIETMGRLRDIFHEEDPTRPVQVGCNFSEQTLAPGFTEAIDVVGFNYRIAFYREFHKKRPLVPILGSETSSCVSSRGEYFFPVSVNKGAGAFDFQVSSYDLYAPPWAYKPDDEFEAQDRNPFVAGEFVWTGFDYLGEPTPYNDDSTLALNFQDPALKAESEKASAAIRRLMPPSRSSYFGIIDLAGFPKDRYWAYLARWRPELPSAHIFPHWTWPGREGKNIPVHAYTSGDEAELFLNGKSLGRRAKGEYSYRLVWDDVVYTPGELLLIAYREGKEWACDSVSTAGKPCAISVKADRQKIRAHELDISFVTVRVEDDKGRTVPRAANALKFSVSGPAEIAGLCNGDATSHEPFKSDRMKAYNGLCLAVIKSRKDEKGRIVLKVDSDGLRSASLFIDDDAP